MDPIEIACVVAEVASDGSIIIAAINCDASVRLLRCTKAVACALAQEIADTLSRESDTAGR
jgi:hypothetical protein